jgi:hypothetical protein
VPNESPTADLKADRGFSNLGRLNFALTRLLLIVQLAGLIELVAFNLPRTLMPPTGRIF